MILMDEGYCQINNKLILTILFIIHSVKKGFLLLELVFTLYQQKTNSAEYKPIVWQKKSQCA